MAKLRLDLDGLKVDRFDTGRTNGEGTVLAHDESCSNQPTCGIASRGPELYDKLALTRYACCV